MKLSAQSGGEKKKQSQDKSVEESEKLEYDQKSKTCMLELELGFIIGSNIMGEQ